MPVYDFYELLEEGHLSTGLFEFLARQFRMGLPLDVILHNPYDLRHNKASFEFASRRGTTQLLRLIYPYRTNSTHWVLFVISAACNAAASIEVLQPQSCPTEACESRLHYVLQSFPLAAVNKTLLQEPYCTEVAVFWNLHVHISQPPTSDSRTSELAHARYLKDVLEKLQKLVRCAETTGTGCLDVLCTQNVDAANCWSRLFVTLPRVDPEGASGDSVAFSSASPTIHLNRRAAGSTALTAAQVGAPFPKHYKFEPPTPKSGSKRFFTPLPASQSSLLKRYRPSGSSSSGSAPPPPPAGAPAPSGNEVPASVPSRLYLPFLHGQHVSMQLHEFLRAKLLPPLCMRTQEVGGGGDCLFHSIGAILDIMLHLHPASSAHVLRYVPSELFAENRLAMVRYLRLLSAEFWASRDAEFVLNYLVAGALRERVPGAWMDGWSPREKLCRHGFQQLLQCDTVDAVGASPANPGCITITTTETVAERNGGRAAKRMTIIPQGETLLARLVQDVRSELEKLGNNHWGDLGDVRALCERLDLGLLIFADGLQNNGTECLCSLDLTRGNFAYWAAVWWQDGVHFRVGEVACEKDLCYASVWSTDSLPESLRLQYDNCNRHAPFGSQRSLEVT